MMLEQILRLAPVVPVLTIDDADHAVPLARALVEGGLKALEVTLRTPAAIEAIRRIAGEVEGAVVGAGTVLNAADLDRTTRAGARFAVSPGLMDGAEAVGPVPLLPGIATASELMRGLEAGFVRFKLFPAVPVGGVALLKSFAPVFPKARFCPTGGITQANVGEFLALANVECVGGSWVAPADAVAAGDWARITSLSRAAAALPGAGART
jgi:2-dehydro-3-deoxyphosphogluconate aldolase/(4S)-4-hydroxy-2-oxoglutarate aldolase